MADHCRHCGNKLGGGFSRNGLCVYCFNELQDKQKESKNREEETKRHNLEMERAAERAAERDRENARRAAQREEEHQQELLEQAERHQQELLEQEERHHQEMLDATLPWYYCSHCGKKERQDRMKNFDGDLYCSSCTELTASCAHCKVTFVNDHPLTVYVKHYNSKEDKAKGIVKEIKKKRLRRCPDCLELLKIEKPGYFDKTEQAQRKATYEKLEEEKAAIERAQQEKREREEEQRRQEEKRRKQLAAQLAEEEALANKKKDEKNYFGGCFSVILLLAALFILGYQSQVGWGVAAGVGVILAVVSFLLRSLTSKLFAGLIVGAIFELIFGLAISGVCYFMWDAFLVPLAVCFVIFFVLGTILYAAGVLDSKLKR